MSMIKFDKDGKKVKQNVENEITTSQLLLI